MAVSSVSIDGNETRYYLSRAPKIIRKFLSPNLDREKISKLDIKTSKITSFTVIFDIFPLHVVMFYEYDIPLMGASRV